MTQGRSSGGPHVRPRKVDGATNCAGLLRGLQNGAHQLISHQIIRSSYHQIIVSSDHQIIVSSARQLISAYISSSAHQLISSSAHQLISFSIHRYVDACINLSTPTGHRTVPQPVERCMRRTFPPCCRWDDVTVSPVIRQTLLHWAYELTDADFEAWRQRKSK